MTRTLARGCIYNFQFQYPRSERSAQVYSYQCSLLSASASVQGQTCSHFRSFTTCGDALDRYASRCATRGQMGPSGLRRNRSATSRRRPAFWIGPISGARSGTPSAQRHAPRPSRREQNYQLYLHRSWLWHGNVDQALQGLHDLGQGLDAEPGEAIHKAITYLEHQRPWIGSYEHWRKLGYPVGSGMIERAVSLVINRRMKKRGMRWCRPNATAVVALRTDLLNDDWILPQRLRVFP